MNPIAIRPAWIVGTQTPPRRNHWLIARDGIIEEISSRCPDSILSADRYELDQIALLPGFINSHCHLEFSHLRQPIPSSSSFVSWIQRVIQHRASEIVSDTIVTRRKAIQKGIYEAWSTGTRFVLDNVTAPWEPQWVAEAIERIRSSLSDRAAVLFGESPIRIEPCVELVDINQRRKQESLAFFEYVRKTGQRTHLSPHAPYTASAEFVGELVAIANASHCVLSMHLAESFDEMAWLDGRTGPFLTALQAFRDSEFEVRRDGLDDYWKALHLGQRILIAHGNHLSENELKMFGENRRNMAIVHCPRTYHHFRDEGRPTYPFLDRDQMEIEQFLGTDSRASNPDLNMWSDLRWLHAQDIQLEPLQILRAMTSSPAAFLGLDHLGDIAMGKSCQVTALRLDASSREEKDVYKTLIQSREPLPLELILFGQATS